MLDGLFSGLQDELGRAGAPMVDWVGDVAALTEQGWMPRYASELRSRACSRALLEHVLRRRVQSNPSVTIIDCVEVDGLLTSPARAGISGVRLSPRGGGGKRMIREMAADLVVDASGRTSCAPEWLRGLGFAAPEETVVNARLAYASRAVRLPASFQPGWKVLLQRFRASRGRRGGGLYPSESGDWLVTLGGAQEAQPPIDEAGFMEFARKLRPEALANERQPLLYDLLREAQPLSPIVGYQRTDNRLRHYERLAALPDGMVVLGDAVCAFNPVYGQGMSAAAMGAELLFGALRSGLQPGFALNFQRALAKQNATAWLLATGDDTRGMDEKASVALPVAARLKQRYIETFLAMAGRDRAAHHAFMRVAHLVAAPSALFAPALAARVFARMALNVAHNGGQRRAAKGAIA